MKSFYFIIDRLAVSDIYSISLIRVTHDDIKTIDYPLKTKRIKHHINVDHVWILIELEVVFSNIDQQRQEHVWNY